MKLASSATQYKQASFSNDDMISLPNVLTQAHSASFPNNNQSAKAISNHYRIALSNLLEKADLARTANCSMMNYGSGNCSQVELSRTSISSSEPPSSYVSIDVSDDDDLLRISNDTTRPKISEHNSHDRYECLLLSHAWLQVVMFKWLASIDRVRTAFVCKGLFQRFGVESVVRSFKKVRRFLENGYGASPSYMRTLHVFWHLRPHFLKSPSNSMPSHHESIADKGQTSKDKESRGIVMAFRVAQYIYSCDDGIGKLGNLLDNDYLPQDYSLFDRLAFCILFKNKSTQSLRHLLSKSQERDLDLLLLLRHDLFAGDIEHRHTDIVSPRVDMVFDRSFDEKIDSNSILELSDGYKEFETMLLDMVRACRIRPAEARRLLTGNLSTTSSTLVRHDEISILLAATGSFKTSPFCFQPRRQHGSSIGLAFYIIRIPGPHSACESLCMC